MRINISSLLFNLANFVFAILCIGVFALPTYANEVNTDIAAGESKENDKLAWPTLKLENNTTKTSTKILNINQPDKRSGLYQLGLGLEVPMIGVITDVSAGRINFGYTIGGALSWELSPNVLIRAYGANERAFGVKSKIKYQQVNTNAADATVKRLQDANWFGAEIGFGVAYLWREVFLNLSPYIGADGGAVFSGYEYIFSSTDPLIQQDILSNTTDKKQDIHEALTWNWLATVRGGVRMSMLKWLSTQADVSVSYVPASLQLVTNTYTALGVRSLGESVIFIRMTFSVRLGL
ncbi:MAG: hypothetical protein JW841_05220 [Deltaproteobacteria bacterium]|nr:hypothetical protein [Deltaproteobacteria bacterium]